MTKNDNHQFHIPQNPHDTSTVTYGEIIQSVPTALSSYEELKKLEALVYTYRHRAATMGQNPFRQSTDFLQSIGLKTAQAVTLHDLVEGERLVSGQLFGGNGCQFWLDAERAEDTVRGVADWYFLQPAANQVQPSVVRYQTTRHGIHKLYAGVECQLSDGELRHFMMTVPLYLQLISAMYAAAASSDTVDAAKTTDRTV